MDAQPTLKTDRLLLRPLNLSDASDVQRLAGDFRIAEMIENIPHPYQDGMAETWIESLKPGWETQRQATFAIHRLEQRGLIGCCGLTLVARHRRASLGYWLGTEFWGNGYCTEAAEAVVRFGFKELELNRIEAQHLTKNPASGAVMRKLGMTHEASMSGYVLKLGHFENMEQYSKIAD